MKIWYCYTVDKYVKKHICAASCFDLECRDGEKACESLKKLAVEVQHGSSYFRRANVWYKHVGWTLVLKFNTDDLKKCYPQQLCILDYKVFFAEHGARVCWNVTIVSLKLAFFSRCFLAFRKTKFILSLIGGKFCILCLKQPKEDTGRVTYQNTSWSSQWVYWWAYLIGLLNRYHYIQTTMNRFQFPNEIFSELLHAYFPTLKVFKSE